MTKDLDIVKEYRLSNKPSLSEYVRAFKAVSLTERDTAVLTTQYNAPGRTVTATQLASLAGIGGGHPVVNLLYGGLGHRLCDILGIRPQLDEDSDKPRWWSILSVGHHRSDNSFLWEMHQEVATALGELALVESETYLPEEVKEGTKYREGSVRRIQINAFERNPQARTECLNHHGSSCSICGLELRDIYGEAARGYIHVHHLRPLAEVGAEYEVDPIDDLRPVCPNCHAVIHLKTPSFTIDEMKAMLTQAKSGDDIIPE